MHAICRVAFFDDDSILSGALERHMPTKFYMRFVRQVAERGDSRGQALQCAELFESPGVGQTHERSMNHVYLGIGAAESHAGFLNVFST